MKARPCRTTSMSLHHDLLILCARIDFDPYAASRGRAAGPVRAALSTARRPSIGD
jgi:hypothetical protein